MLNPAIVAPVGEVRLRRAESLGKKWWDSARSRVFKVRLDLVGNNADHLAYQSLRCSRSGGNCASIAGATGKTYLLTGSDVGWKIGVRVTATNAAGSGSATSEPTAVVKRAT